MGGTGPRPMRYEVDARIVTPGRAEVTTKRTTIAFDSSPGAGDELPGPAELLAAAFSACLLKNVERFSVMQPFRQSGAWVHVEVERRDTPPAFTRITYELHVVTDETQRRVDLLHHNLQRYGTVFDTLAAACEVTGEIIAEPAPSPSG